MIKFFKGIGTVAHKTLIGVGVVATLAIGGAIADIAITAGAGTTIFGFTCFTTKNCTASVPITSAGVEIPVATSTAQGVTTATPATTPTGAGAETEISLLKTITNAAVSPLPAQSGISGATTPIGAVLSAAIQYETVAASQTGQALGATGATGDYLSHCVIYPVTTGAGAVTVFDNTNAAATNVITFTSGTLSNLAPIALPVGAVSTAGAWKVTTGTNVTVTCYGKFT